MCFSAQASFIASGLLLLLGYISLKKISQKNYIPFASIPLLFGIQQAFEGIVWITRPLPDYHTISIIASYGFLFFAFLLWPIWIPFAMIQLEDNIKIKKFLYYLLIIGITISLSILANMIYYGINITISCNHIEYVINMKSSTLIMHICNIFIYCLATITPLFISSKPYMKYCGIAMLFSSICSLILYTQYFTSTWCFFSAILSGLIIWII